MKKSFILMLVVAMMTLSTVFAASNFSDVNGHWAENSIARWSEEGIVNGYEDDTFNPEGLLTRAELVAMIIRVFEPTEIADLKAYNDVDEDAWYYEALSKAAAMGLINGYEDNTMKPNAYVTRQEAFTMLNRAYGLAKAEGALNDFEDAENVADWAKEAFGTFISNGFVGGYPDNTLQPEGLIKRSEIAKVLDNSIGKIIKEKGTYDLSDVEGIVIVKAKNVKLNNAKDSKVFALNNDVKKSLKTDSEVSVIVKEEEKETEKPSSTGGGGGGSSKPASVATITVTSGDGKYAIAISEAVANGKKLTVVIDGETVVSKYAVAESTLKANVTTIVNKLDAVAVVNTLTANYNNKAELRELGLAMVEAMTTEQKAVATAAAILNNGDVALVEDVYTALIDSELITAEEIKTLAIDTLFSTFEYAEIINIINSL